MRRLYYLLVFLLLCLFPSCAGKGPQSDNIVFSSLDDLEGLQVGLVIGSAADIHFSSEGGIHAHRYNNPAEVIHSLELGRIDVAILESRILNDPSVQEKGFKTVMSGLNFGSFGFAFKRDDLSLVGQYDSYFNSLVESGEYDRIEKLWSSEGFASAPMTEYEFGHDWPALNVGLIAGNKPFSFIREEEFVGLEPEIINGFAHSIGRRPVYHEYELINVSAGLEGHKVDMAAGAITISSNRLFRVKYSQPYLESDCVVLRRTATEHGSIVKNLKEDFKTNLIEEERFKIILEGLWVTLVVSFFSLLFGTLLGALICWRAFSRHHHFWHRFLSVYGAIIHGIPLLVLLMLMYYIFLAPTSLSGIMVAIITFTIYFTFVCSEIFIKGISSVKKGQWDAAQTLGFTKFQTVKYIVLPQAARQILPFYEGEMVTLIKETCLVGFIAIVDLTKASDIIQSLTFNSFFPLLFTAAIYFVIIFLVSKGLSLLIDKLPGKK